MRRASVAEAYDSRTPILEILAQSLEALARDALMEVEHIDRVSFRVKGKTSFIDKAKSAKYVNPLVEIEDQVAGRVITFFRDDISVVRDCLVTWFGPVEHQEKSPERADQFGYESDHFVFVIAEHLKPEGWNGLPDMPTTFELQIRTLFMHAWAEPQHDLGYKGKDLDQDVKRKLAWVAASAWGADTMLNDVASALVGERTEPVRPADGQGVS